MDQDSSSVNGLCKSLIHCLKERKHKVFFMDRTVLPTYSSATTLPVPSYTGLLTSLFPIPTHYRPQRGCTYVVSHNLYISLKFLRRPFTTTLTLSAVSLYSSYCLAPTAIPSTF